ncbi:MAG: ABC transporter permease [Ruminococcus sp.]
MKRKLQNTTYKIAPLLALAVIAGIWLFVCEGEIVPAFMLPSPVDVFTAFVNDFPLLLTHAQITLQEALYGLLIGIALAFIIASLMDRFQFLYNAFYPLLVLSQTIPTVAIAPLLVLWMGFEMAPKITLVVITTFFPITIGLLDGFKSVDKDQVNLMRSMKANRFQTFYIVKIPTALPSFFAGLKISASYAIVGAVIAEWLGGFEGLGVYMTRVKKAYAFDKMFAVIIFICIISLLLILLVTLIQRLAMPWLQRTKNKIN